MKLTLTRVVVLTLILGVCSIVAFSVRRIRKDHLPLHTVCEIVENPESYNSKTFRFQGIIFGHDEMGLYSPDCNGAPSYIHADFNRESWKQFRAKAEPVGKFYFMGEQDQYMSNVILEGTLKKEESIYCDEKGRQTGFPKFSYTIYCYVFVISDVEHVEKTDVPLPK